MSVIMRNDIEVGGTDDDVIAKVGTAELTTQADDLSAAVNELNSSLTELQGFKHISRIATATVSMSINASTSGSGTTQVPAPASNETVYFFFRNATWCIPQTVSISGTTMSVTSINPSATAHNCSVTYYLVYVKN